VVALDPQGARTFGPYSPPRITSYAALCALGQQEGSVPSDTVPAAAAELRRATWSEIVGQPINYPLRDRSILPGFSVLAAPAYPCRPALRLANASNAVLSKRLLPMRVARRPAVRTRSCSPPSSLKSFAANTILAPPVYLE
jgi:hypothetical protein